MPVNTTVQVRRGTAAQWASANPVLAAGELGWDTTNSLLKVGDGSTAWASLAQASLTAGAVTSALITDGTIATGDIASGAITSALIADGAITITDMSAAALAGRNLYLASNYR